MPGRLVQSGASLTVNQGVAGSSPGPYAFVEIYHEIISTVILPLLLIQEGIDVSFWRKYAH